MKTKADRSVALKDKHKQADWSSADFISATVHQLNNYLSAISGFAEISMLDLEENSELKRYLNEIILAVNRNTEFNQYLLMMSGKNKPSIANVSNRIVENELKKINFEVLTEPNKDYIIKANQQWLIKTFRAINEFSVSIGSPHSELSIFFNGKFLQFIFSISQTEKEISVDDFFQPYYTTKVLASSKGLGLCWLPSLMQQLNGEISVSKNKHKQLQIQIQFLIGDK